MTSGEWSVAARELEPNIEIPDLERFPLPPSLVVQGKFGNWHDAILSRVVPNLRGPDWKKSARKQVVSSWGKYSQFLLRLIVVFIHGVF